MTRDEYLSEIKEIQDNFYIPFTIKYEALDAAMIALRGAIPDPLTGLVPCGCGGKAEYYYHPIADWVEVGCVDCGANTSYKDTKEQARGAWNTAMSSHTPSGAIGPEQDGTAPNGDKGAIE